MKNASIHLGTSQSRVNCDGKNWSKLEERGQGCIAKKRRYFLLHLTCRYICDILFNNKIINILLFTFIFWIISNRIFVQTILYLTWGFLLIKRRGVTNLQFT